MLDDDKLPIDGDDERVTTRERVLEAYYTQ
jgi:hypothetical protein